MTLARKPIKQIVRSSRWERQQGRGISASHLLHIFQVQMHNADSLWRTLAANTLAHNADYQTKISGDLVREFSKELCMAINKLGLHGVDASIVVY
jgi:hypothetical protein